MILDLTIYESADGGELALINEDLATVEGLTNQVYLALFGGNVEQNTSSSLDNVEQRFDFWGNFYLETVNQFNSEFERKLVNITLTSGGVNDLVESAKRDLKFLEDYADIKIEGNILDVNKFQLLVSLTEPNKQSTKISFIWDGTRNEVIYERII